MAKRPIFDTSVFSGYSSEIENIYLSSLFPSIVLYELVATSLDEETLKKYDRWRVSLNKIHRLITPTANDWWETAKSIRRLYLNKSAQANKLKTLRNDALLSRLAIKHDAFIVTNDIDDFQLIKKDMKQLVIVPAPEFFEQ
jgi:predicted nucleic acid-binding protein